MADDDAVEHSTSIAYDNAALLQTSHQFIRNYIQVIDRKASILLTVLLTILGLFANALRTGAIELTLVEAVAASFASFFAALALVLSAWVVYPRANVPEDPGYIYWEKIVNFGNHETIKADIKTVTETEALEELAGDTFEISRIAKNKYESLRWAMKATFLSGAFATFAVMNALLTRLHTFASFVGTPIGKETHVLLASALVTVLFLVFTSWFISAADDQIEDTPDFWRGQLENFGERRER